MTEKELRDYLDYLNTLGRVPGLENIRNLCKELGDPQDHLSFIHIAGTNAKGSVGAYLAGALTTAGLKVGRYISPTIVNWRERIMIGNRMISKKDLLEGMEVVKGACDEMQKKGLSQPTSFEVETALGFLYFLKKGCDIVILECGMGGELDATNVVKTTLMEVITPIGMDHEAFLGNTLSAIAGQKAGIIKPHTLVVSGAQEKEAAAVLETVCKKQNARLAVCDPEEIDKIRYGMKKQSFRYKKRFPVSISLAGTYQIDNAHLAVKALDVLTGETALEQRDQMPEVALRSLDIIRKKVTEKKIAEGMLTATWPARFQLLSQKPTLVIDGAHNRPAAKRLAQSLKFYFPNRRIVYIMGVFQDKDVEGILEETAQLAAQIIAIRLPDAQRSMDALSLAKAAAKYNPNVTTADSVEEALEMAGLLAGKEGVIVAFGSLSYLGRIIELKRDSE